MRKFKMLKKATDAESVKTLWGEMKKGLYIRALKDLDNCAMDEQVRVILSFR